MSPNGEAEAGLATRPTRRGSSLAQRLAEVGERSFVGRDTEIRDVQFALDSTDPPFVLLWLHGPGGIGKSALLNRLGALAASRGIPRVTISGGTTEPTPEAFLAALERLGWHPVWNLDATRPRLLLIDVMDELAPLESWLREEFLPSLPRGCLVVVAGRYPPSPEWRSSLEWQGLVRVRRLGDLDHAECLEYVESRLVTGEDATWLAAASFGHPLALTLLVDEYWQRAGSGDPSRHRLRLSDNPDVVAVLLARFAPELPTARHRLALHVFAHARVTTEALLRYVLDEHEQDARPTAGELFVWLRGLAFAEATPEGLLILDLPRTVLDADFRWRDPDGFRALHRRLRDYYYDGTGSTGAEADVRWAARGLVHLSGRGALRLFRPRRGPVTFQQGLQERQAADSDRSDVLSLVGRSDEAEAAPLVEAWWDAQPEAFRAIRERSGALAGFVTQLVLPAPSVTPGGNDRPAVVTDDPAVAALYRWIAGTSPLREGEHVLAYRFWSGEHVQAGRTTRPGEEPGPWSDVLWERLARLVLSRGMPAYTVYYTAQPGLWRPYFDLLDHCEVPQAAVSVGGIRYVPFAHDWRAVPVAQWMNELFDRELGAPSASRAEAAAPAHVVLTAPQFAAAVKHSLRNYRRPVELRANPLLRSRVLAEHARSGTPGVQDLRELIEAAVQPLGDDARHLLEATYLHFSLTQEAAARGLGVPFSTFRRHLATAVRALTQQLWAREVNGS